MKKILVINQPTGNRGDESAHKALIRSLAARFPNFLFRIVFFGEERISIGTMMVDLPNVEYASIPPFRGKTRLPRILYRYNLESLLDFHPAYRKIKKEINDSDYVICAPGGICMGGFMNWNHIHLLLTSKRLGKHVAYYSRSFGPFSETNSYNKKFKRLSVGLLRSFDFLSIRDRKSMKIAEELNITYTPSIDSAFLEKLSFQIPGDINRYLNYNDYILLVPNSLTWHPHYRSCNQCEIDNFYLEIIKLISSKFPSSSIIMMPQLYGQKAGDYEYFSRLKEMASDITDIHVLNDSISSDIQQAIMKNAKLAIGARYHSIIFAINNEVPFVSLSYEHKMFGMLSELNLESRQVDITGIGQNTFCLDSCLSKISRIIDEGYFDASDRSKTATQLALNCFNKFACRLADR